MKCLHESYISGYCFAVDKHSGSYDLVCVYTDYEYSIDDLARWQQIYNSSAPEGEDPMTCVLLTSLPTPADIRYLIDNELI